MKRMEYCAPPLAPSAANFIAVEPLLLPWQDRNRLDRNRAFVALKPKTTMENSYLVTIENLSVVAP